MCSNSKQSSFPKQCSHQEVMVATFLWWRTSTNRAVPDQAKCTLSYRDSWPGAPNTWCLQLSKIFNFFSHTYKWQTLFVKKVICCLRHIFDKSIFAMGYHCAINMENFLTLQNWTMQCSLVSFLFLHMWLHYFYVKWWPVNLISSCGWRWNEHAQVVLVIMEPSFHKLDHSFQ